MDQKIIWDYYQDGAADSFQDALPRLRFLVKQACKINSLRERSTILNIGVGNGYLERCAASSGFITFSLDPSEIAIAKVQQSGGQGKKGYIEAIPYEDEAFDFIFCSEVLEHLTDSSLGTAMSELKRVLKPGGHLLGTVPFNEVLRANITICPHCATQFHRWGHEQTFNKDSMRTVLQQAGLHIVRLETRAFPVFSGKNIFNRVISLGRSILGKLGHEAAVPNLVFIARKS